MNQVDNTMTRPIRLAAARAMTISQARGLLRLLDERKVISGEMLTYDQGELIAAQQERLRRAVIHLDSIFAETEITGPVGML